MKIDANSAPGKRNWLCIAYAFPPINRSGTHRTTAFVRGLAPLGWQATVLTVVPPKDEPLDPVLMTGVSDCVEIVTAQWLQPISLFKRLLRKCLGAIGISFHRKWSQAQATGAGNTNHSVARGMAGLLATPDSRVGWIMPAVWKGLGVIRRRRPEILYSTSPYASAHLIALVLNRLMGVPWVADFRDPWCGNPFLQSRPRIVERVDAWLERCVLKYASRVVCNTPTMTQSFVARHPKFKTKFCTILNGIDVETVQSVRPRRLAPAGHFVFLHCGQFYGPRSPSVLFEAFHRLITEFPRESENVRLAFVGPPVFQGQSLVDLAANVGLSDRIIACGEKSHTEALQLTAGADALVLVGASGPGSELQIPQKLFEYLALRRPILGLLSADNPATSIMKDSQADVFVCDPDDPIGVARAMMQLIDPLRTISSQAWSGVHRFDRSVRVQELHAVFQALAGQDSTASEARVAETYVTATCFRESEARAKKNTATASSSIIAASAKRIKATHATLLPPAP